MTPADEFLDVARQFCALVDEADLPPRRFVERLCEVLPRLYAAAVVLPAEVADDEFEQRLTQEEWRDVYSKVADRFGAANMYWLVYDQFDHTQQDVVAGALADDIADIYRDLREALADPRGGAAAGDWRMEFDIHWSEHAARAIAALNQLRAGTGLAPAL